MSLQTRAEARSSLGAMAGVAAAIALGACGSAAGDRLAAVDAATLKGELAVVQVAAAGGERSRALAELADFGARVQRLGASGRLSQPEAQALALGVQQALSAARRKLPQPAPALASTQALPAPAAAPPPPSPKPKHEPKPKHDSNNARHGHGHHHGGGQ